MIEKPAKDVQGFLLYNPFEKDYFFRIYGGKDANGHKQFKDYQLCAVEIEVIINTNYVSLYEGEEENKIDFSSKVLGRAYEKRPRQEPNQD